MSNNQYTPDNQTIQSSNFSNTVKPTIDRINLAKEKVLGSYNSEKPLFYKVAFQAKVTTEPFLNDECKKYYLQLIKKTTTIAPIKIIAINIIRNSVCCIVSTHDNFDETIKSHFNSINEAYLTQYYKKMFSYDDCLFKQEIKIKKILSLDELLNSIVSVHKLSQIEGLGNYKTNKFSSYTTALTNDSIVDMSDLSFYFQQFSRAEFVNMHKQREYVSDPIFDYTQVNEKVFFKELCKKYKTKTKRYRPEIIPDMFIDYYSETGLNFECFALKFKMSVEEKRAHYLDIAVNLFFKKYDFFGISSILNVMSNELLFLAIYEINARKEYGIFSILKSFNIQYTPELMDEFINYICEAKNISFESLAVKFNFFGSVSSVRV